MDRFNVDGLELAYELNGEGQPVVLIHAAAFTPWYQPLVERMPQYSTLRYTRNPTRADSGGLSPLTLSADAGACAKLLAHIGWPAAHVVGHSYGALVALRLAQESPGVVRSLALLEPAIREIPSAEQVRVAMAPVMAAYRAGDKETAIDLFLQHVCGADYRQSLDTRLPDSFRVSVEYADVFFQVEIPVVQEWSLGSGPIHQPVLNVLGSRSERRFVEGAELLQAWLPHAERFTLPDAGHLLQVENPAGLATKLGEFFDRHLGGTYHAGPHRSLTG